MLSTRAIAGSLGLMARRRSRHVEDNARFPLDFAERARPPRASVLFGSASRTCCQTCAAMSRRPSFSSACALSNKGCVMDCPAWPCAARKNGWNEAAPRRTAGAQKRNGDELFMFVFTRSDTKGESWTCSWPPESTAWSAACNAFSALLAGRQSESQEGWTHRLLP